MSRPRRHRKLALDVIEQVGRGVIARAPGGVTLVAHVRVHVDHRRHDCLAGHVNNCRALRHGHARLGADGGDAAVRDDQAAVFNRRAAIAVKNPRAVEDCDAAGLAVHNRRRNNNRSKECEDAGHPRILHPMTRSGQRRLKPSLSKGLRAEAAS
jgi:hypothetical protein